MAEGSLYEAAGAIAPAIGEGIAEVRSRIDAAAASAGRDPSDVDLVTVTKGRSTEETLGAWLAGAGLLGESRADELVRKAGLIASALDLAGVERLVAATPDAAAAVGPEWHFIGHLQRNKVRQVIGVADTIHSLDSARLASEIKRRADRTGVEPPRCYVEVNLTGEEQKHGVREVDLAELLVRIDETGIRPAGLMCMATQGATPAEAGEVFAHLARLRHDMVEMFPGRLSGGLSMGMSDDFEAAIAEGSTVVRVGRAIFSYLR